jgi:hypothetical protein
MQVIQKTALENGKQVNYQFDNGFYGYVNQHGFTLRGVKGGKISPNTPNWLKAKKAIELV